MLRKIKKKTDMKIDLMNSRSDDFGGERKKKMKRKTDRKTLRRREMKRD